MSTANAIVVIAISNIEMLVVGAVVAVVVLVVVVVDALVIIAVDFVVVVVVVDTSLKRKDESGNQFIYSDLGQKS